MRIAAQWLVLVLLAGITTACGFALRGEAVLPAALRMASLDVADPYSPLSRDLSAALRRGGVDLRAAGTAGAGRIAVPVNAFVVEPLTVGAEARVQEYVVRYRVELEAAAADGSVLLARTPIVLERDYSFDETQALGAQAQQDLIVKELQREMVQQILRRLASLR
jgi:LPS-assembly lipoprotein